MKYTGLGFRKEIADEILGLPEQMKPSFVELAPENWIELGGFWGKKLAELSERYSITTHGLSLSIGSPDPLDWNFIKQVKLFLDEYKISVYSEHLSYSQTNNAHLYDLLPIPFRKDAVKHISMRIKEVQDYLERPLVIENVSYYTPVAAEMKEQEFISEIVKESGCKLLLDINNVYVNAFNHNYDAKEFISQLPLSEVAYIHMAGHEQVEPDLIIDTHGQPIIDQVFDLFEWTLPQLKPVPILLERDFNIPSMDEIHQEMTQLDKIAIKSWTQNHKKYA